MKITVRAAITLFALFLLSLPFAVAAQQQRNADQTEPVAQRSDVYCTGFISEVAPRVGIQVIGGLNELTKIHYAEGDVVYLNQGRGSGVMPGAVYYVHRPLGEVKHPFTNKKLGYYVRELGMVRVIEAQDQTATAMVSMSCDVIELGDTLKLYEEANAPNRPEPRPLGKFTEGSGGLKGQIVMATGHQEQLSANRVVFIDIGERQDVRAGDTFTIYRAVGEREGIVRTPKDNVVDSRSNGYQSDRYQGGNVSNQATRVHQHEVLDSRPHLPRKVVGELTIVKVEKNTATAMITRTTGEVTIGDLVERVN